jgi:hypothetical protein
MHGSRMAIAAVLLALAMGGRGTAEALRTLVSGSLRMQDDQLRQPVFLGLRTDKQAKDVVRE